ncbi:MAG: ABC transporter permease [Balneolaceae bacterium]|nr:ABC transporter permease [Balneolaceae bacterium]
MMNILPIVSLSWKNIWRNKTRSLVVIIAVILGTGAGVFMSAFMYGMSMQFVKSELQNFTSHIQIHTKEYKDEVLPSKFIPNAHQLVNELSSLPFVEEITARTVISGLASTSSSSFGVTINGINIESENTVTELHTHIIEGDFLESKRANSIVVGNKLAQRLSLDIRSKVVINFQDVEGNLTAAAFRVTGVFKSPNSGFDETNVFVKQTHLNALLNADEISHEIAFLVNDFKMADAYRNSLNLDSGLVAESWGDIAPSLRYMDSMVGTMLYIVMAIILIALTFGIINTMLMAVLERQQELGMLMAVGVNKMKTFSMILIETFMLAIVGAPIGMLTAWLGIQILSDTGINVSAWGQGFEAYGIGTIIYPELQPEYYVNVGLLIFITTLIAALYPSYKALKLNPVEAIRKI